MDGQIVADDIPIAQTGVNISLFNLLNAMGQPLTPSLYESFKHGENNTSRLDQMYKNGPLANVFDPRSLVCLLPNQEQKASKKRENAQNNASELSFAKKKPEKFFMTKHSTESINSSSAIKSKGGWPKGRRRSKRPFLKEIAPRAPTTGYVIFLNERRKKYKEICPDLPFGQVTKRIGSEWSSLSPKEKQKYLDQAEIDKKRYRDELKAYQSTNAYQTYMKKSTLESAAKVKAEKKQNHPVITHNAKEEEIHDLYCKVCDQLFVSVHNKKEHLHGKHHLEALAGDIGKSLTNNLAEKEKVPFSALKNSSLLRDRVSEDKNESVMFSGLKSPPTNMNEAIQDVISLNFTREEEVEVLSERLEDVKHENLLLKEQLQQLKEKEQKLLLEQEEVKAHHISLSKQLESLKMIPHLLEHNF